MGPRILSRFVAKIAAAGGLIALGDLLFWREGGVGSNLGIFALCWAVTSLALTPAAWRDRRSWAAAGAALLLAAVLGNDPGPVAVLLFCASLAMAVLLPRFGRFDHAGRWLARLALLGVTSGVGPWRDLFRLRRHVPLRRRLPSLVRLLALPLVCGGVFLGLFASANPLIGDALLRIGAPQLDALTVVRLLFWMVLLTLVWSTLRPRRLALPQMTERTPAMIALPGVSRGSVTLALMTFNALFALQNGLDLAFLWSGAPLPEGVTLAEYAHRGAYPLIMTALLAGLFVLVVLRPGSETAAAPAIRRLVVLWIAQNLLLVASSILRTIDYVEAYSLTELRIAALIWMALVAVGLVLITWRMLRGRSAAWLINANAAAALLVLIACSIADLGAIAAAWNVRHGREAGGKGSGIDLCYLNALGSSALPSLVALELRGKLEPGFAARVAWVRNRVLERTIAQQRGGEWIWRDAQRLREIRAMLGSRKLAAPPSDGPNGRDCTGALRVPPPEPATPAESVEQNAPALTSEARR